MTGIGPAAVCQPSVRDREAGADDQAHPLHPGKPATLRPARVDRDFAPAWPARQGSSWPLGHDHRAAEVIRPQ
jgi:hypothetical protein